nr:subtilisin-like protease sbt4.8 [Quercus suber]
MVLLVATLSVCYGDRDKAKDVYIVYMGSLPEGEYSPTSHHLNILNEVLGESATNNALVRSYTRSFNAFATRVNDDEQQRRACKKEVLSVFQAENSNFKQQESFSDEGFGPPPKKWKGVCDFGVTTFTLCNKLIGARVYTSGGNTTERDKVGHGSRTASTAADGVDIITISIGMGPTPLDSDPIAIDSFHAMWEGILTVQAAGNNGSRNALGTILKSEAIVDTNAPLVAHFSSRGPNSIVADILKSNVDKRSGKYSILSGISMSCPHAAGATAYVKTFYPNWSPSTIKSALMTTAWPMNATKEEDGEFAFGAGHINPVKALEPGLVYDASIDDYIKMLCNINISFFSRCPKDISGSAKDLNYPSMQALIESNNSFTVKFPRIVTNVGPANSTYESKVIKNSQIKVSVEPSTLSFETSGEKKSFIVTVSRKGLPASKMVSASLVWSDGTHNVKSPIVVYTN